MLTFFLSRKFKKKYAMNSRLKLVLYN